MCLRCGVDENITRDHVVPKSVLRLLLDLDEYQRFSAQARYVNIQPLCSGCNNLKGWKAIDYRPRDEHELLLVLLEEWELDVNWVEDKDLE